jgi:hypothetical protein
MSEPLTHFHGATRVLVGAGPIKQRLIDAYRGHLAGLRDTDLPEELRADFVALNTSLHSAHAAGGLSAPEVACRKMSEKEAADHAAGILEMFATLAALREREAAQTPRLRVVGERLVDDDLPAFLSRA